MSSLPSSQYTSTSTTQPNLHSLHLALERERILARRAMPPQVGPSQPPSVPTDAARGPRVMVLGPPASGKTTVVKNLVNMALGTGMGWNVGVAGLDPSSVSNYATSRLTSAGQPHPWLHLPLITSPPSSHAPSCPSLWLTTRLSSEQYSQRGCSYPRMVVRPTGAE